MFSNRFFDKDIWNARGRRIAVAINKMRFSAKNGPLDEIAEAERKVIFEAAKAAAHEQGSPSHLRQTWIPVAARQLTMKVGSLGHLHEAGAGVLITLTGIS